MRKGTYVFVGFRPLSRWCTPRRHVCSALRVGRCTWWRVSGPSGGRTWWARSWSVSIGGRAHSLCLQYSRNSRVSSDVTWHVESSGVTILVFFHHFNKKNDENWWIVYSRISDQEVSRWWPWNSDHDPLRQRNYNWLKVICNSQVIVNDLQWNRIAFSMGWFRMIQSLESKEMYWKQLVTSSLSSLFLYSSSYPRIWLSCPVCAGAIQDNKMLVSDLASPLRSVGCEGTAK